MLVLTKQIFTKLIDLLIDNKTQEFINYFNDGCVNINFKGKFVRGYYNLTTILSIAGLCRNMKAMKCLINNGASFNIETKYFSSNKYYTSVFYELCHVIFNDDNNMYIKFRNYDVDNYVFMKFCLDNGADPNLKINKSSFQYIIPYVKEDIIELFINYGANVHDNILRELIYNKKIKLESKLELINKIKCSYTDDELYDLSKQVSVSDLSDKDDIAKELDTIESDNKSAAKIKIA